MKDTGNNDWIAKRLSIPEAGIEFKRFASPKCVRLVASFRSEPKAGCGRHDRNEDHVYELRIARGESVCLPTWVAMGFCDGALSFTVCATCRHKCELLALSAFKGYLRRVLRKTIANRRAKTALGAADSAKKAK